jgi:hypothetical protein
MDTSDDAYNLLGKCVILLENRYEFISLLCSQNCSKKLRKYYKNTIKVLKCDVGEGWRRSGGQIV